MSTHATGTFEIESWDEKPYDEREGAKLARARMRKTFHGDIEGESSTELLLPYAQEGSAAYAGFEPKENYSRPYSCARVNVVPCLVGSVSSLQLRWVF
jgi:hypothetical protein